MAKKTNINELARRYTTASFELAASKNQLDAVSADLGNVDAQLLGDAKTAKFLNSPLLTPAKQVEFIKGVAKELNVNPITLNLLLVVARNGRLGNLKAIIEAFLTRKAEEKNEVKAKITSAAKLSDDELKKITDDLSKRTGKTVIVNAEVDESLIGGLVVKIGSAMYDNSVKTKLNRLAEQLKKAS